MNGGAADDRGGGKHARPRVVVIGYGSPIRGDDAVGPIVADRLREQMTAPDVEVISRHVLTAELAESLRAATLVVFIDAAVTGQAGQVTTHRLHPDTDAAGGMAHTLDAGALLGWVRQLYGTAPAAMLVSTRAESLAYANYRLTPAVQAMVTPMVDRVRTLIREHLDAPAHS